MLFCPVAIILNLTFLRLNSRITGISLISSAVVPMNKKTLFSFISLRNNSDLGASPQGSRGIEDYAPEVAPSIERMIYLISESFSLG